MSKGFIVIAPFMISNIATIDYLDALARAYDKNISYVELTKLVSLIDYLEDSSLVQENQIAIYGISMGGRWARLITAIDKRVKVCVDNGSLGSLAKLQHFILEYNFESTTRTGRELYVGGCGTTVLASKWMKRTSNADIIIQYVFPRPYMVEIGNKDGHHRYSPWSEFEKIKQVYQQAGLAERAEYYEFIGWHEIPKDGRAIGFLTKYLMPDKKL